MTKRARVLLGVLAGVLAAASALVGFWLWTTRSQTRYASLYSESAFRDIAIGTTRDEVLRRIGQPLSVTDKGSTEVWYYSEPLKSKNYSHRALVFDKQQKNIIGKGALDIVD